MLTDKFLRRHDYLRVSLTDKCNLRCIYCMPPEGVPFLPHHEVLRNEEFVDIINFFVARGVKKVRFTGGEPLVRRGFDDIIGEIHHLYPDVELALTTNGVLLGEHLATLRECGLRKLNISLDTMNRDRYREITMRDHFDDVVGAIDSALGDDFFDVKINAVLFRETLDELDDFLAYCRDKKVVLRFIEKMPFREEDYGEAIVTSDELVAALEQRGGMTRRSESDSQVAQRYDLMYRGEYPVKIGIIPPMTHKFCKQCNRLRLTADGKLKACLHSTKEYDLKEVIRAGEGDEALEKVVREALARKAEGHNLDCIATDGGCASLVNSRTMSKIGG